MARVLLRALVLLATPLLSSACAGEPPPRSAPSPAASRDPVADAAAAIARDGCSAALPPVPSWDPAADAVARPFDVVVYTAHPDDEAMYAGGTMARLVAAGRRVAFVVQSHGEGGRLLERDASGAIVERRDYPREHVVAVRDAEIAEAARAIGVAHAHLNAASANLDYAWTTSCDETLRRWDASVPGGLTGILRRLVDDMRARRPRVVVTLDPRDDPQASHHGHHKAAGVLADAAARLAGGVEEVLSTAPRDAAADVTVDVDPGARLAMLAAYRSQFVADELATDPIAQRPVERFVLRWRAAGAPAAPGSRLAALLAR